MQNRNTTTATAAKPQEMTSTHQEWLNSILATQLLFSADMAKSYEVAYSQFLVQQSEMVNSILVSAYDKQGVYDWVKKEFEVAFGIECKFSNKKIIQTITALSFDQFHSKKVKGKREGIDVNLQTLENHSDLLLDFDFRKWLIKDGETGKFTRATDSLIANIPEILKFINKMLTHNEKDKQSPKKYLIEGKVVTKTLLKDIIKAQESIEAIKDLLAASIDQYNEAFNINIRLSKALKELDKEVLIEFLEGVTTDTIKELLKARATASTETAA